MEPVDVQQTGMKAPPLRWSEENPWKDAPKVLSREWAHEITEAYQAQTERLQAIVDILKPLDVWTRWQLTQLGSYEKEQAVAIKEASRVAREGLK